MIIKILCSALVSLAALNATSQEIGLGMRFFLDGSVYSWHDGGPALEGHRLGLGYTLGPTMSISVSKRISFQVGGAFSKKNYFPDRQFSFSTLKEVHFRAFEAYIHLFIQINKLKDETWSHYVIVGPDFEHQSDFEAKYKPADRPQGIILVRDFLLVSMGYAARRSLNKEKNLFIIPEFNIRFWVGDINKNEYLHRFIDKLGIGFTLEYRLLK